MWEVDVSLIEDWLDQQDLDTMASVFAALELLEDSGPALGRPLVDTLSHTTVANLKELRPASSGESEIWIIFAFDPRRHAVGWRQIEGEERALEMVSLVQEGHPSGRTAVSGISERLGGAIMSNLKTYLDKRGVTEEQMADARRRTHEAIDAYALREARKASGMTQVELAGAMGVSQNRISRMENGDIGTMSVDTLRRYVEAVGGTLSLTAELPTGSIRLA